jgi:hypothetical protein
LAVSSNSNSSSNSSNSRMARAQAQFQLGNRQAAAGEDFDSSAQSSCAIMTDSRNSWHM